MNNKVNEEKIWSYLDNDISIKDKYLIDELRSNDLKFEAKFKELKFLHESLYDLPLQEVEPQFSAKLESVVLKEVSNRRNGLSINPLFIFALLLGSLGTAFYIFGSDSASSISILTGNHLELVEIPLISEILTSLSTINFEVNWYHSIILLIVPCLFIWDKLVEHRDVAKHFVLV